MPISDDDRALDWMQFDDSCHDCECGAVVRPIDWRRHVVEECPVLPCSGLCRLCGAEIRGDKAECFDCAWKEHECESF